MTDLDLTELREIAKAATPGDWTADIGPAALHVATFDPPTVLALIDEIEELRAALVELAKTKENDQ